MATEEFESTSGGKSEGARPNYLVRVALLGLVTLAAISSVGVLMARWQKPSPKADGEAPPTDAPSKQLADLATEHFRSWPTGKKPAAVIVLTGEMHLYEEPCGCTRPLYGGLERRFWFMKTLRDQGVEVIPLDLGDVYYDHFTPGRPTLPKQAMLKYKLATKSMTQMDYAAAGVGKQEFRIPLIDALAETILNEKPSYRILVANLNAREDNFPGMIDDSRVVGKNVKVAVIGNISKSVAAEIVKLDPARRFGENAQVLPIVLKEANKQNPEVRVLLYQGTHEEATALAKVIPDFDIILCLSAESEPPTLPTHVGRTQVIRIGHKGRYVGVVGLFPKADKSFDMPYESLKLGEEFMTPKGQEAANPILQMLEDYTKEVREKDLLSEYPQVAHPMQVKFGNGKPNPSFVGSKSCAECHKAEYKKWDGSKHAVAFSALENAKRPSNRQFDGECVVCHTTGFGYETGYRDSKKTPKLEEVGCESCHGPGSMHVAQPKNKAFAAALSPWKAKPTDYLPDAQVERMVDIQTCQKCHDSDNDPNFKFAKFWPKVAHGPGAAKAKDKDQKEDK